MVETMNKFIESSPNGMADFINPLKDGLAANALWPNSHLPGLTSATLQKDLFPDADHSNSNHPGAVPSAYGVRGGAFCFGPSRGPNTAQAQCIQVLEKYPDETMKTYFVTLDLSAALEKGTALADLLAFLEHPGGALWKLMV